MTDLVVEFRFPARPDRLQELRRVLRDAGESAGLSPITTERIVLAANEACMNVIQHAYKGDPQGEILVKVVDNGPNVELRIVDFAETVDPEHIRPRELEDLRPGGLGTHFMRELMDEVLYLPAEGGKGTCLVMKKQKVD